MKILIVDDSSEDRYVVVRLLTSLYKNIEITEADDLASGLGLTQKQNFDLLLIDYHLPDGSGLDLIKRAAKYSKFNCPAILLTGQGDDKIDQEASAVGAADYIDKHDLNAVSLERSIRFAIRHNSLMLELKKANKQLSELEAFRAHVFDVASEALGVPVSQIRTSVKRLQVELKPSITSQQKGQLETTLGECDKIDEYLSQFNRARTTCAL